METSASFEARYAPSSYPTTYFPFNAKLRLNGHEYAKRQLTRQGIASEALDNGIFSCADPERL